MALELPISLAQKSTSFSRVRVSGDMGLAGSTGIALGLDAKLKSRIFYSGGTMMFPF